MSAGIGLVHDWLTGQRGGEHVLAAIARLAPKAPIYTLFHLPGTVSAEIEAHPIVTSFLPLRGQRGPPGPRRLPRLLLPYPDALRLGPAPGLFPGSERPRRLVA